MTTLPPLSLAHPDLEKASQPQPTPATSHIVDEPTSPTSKHSKEIVSQVASNCCPRQLAKVQRPIDRFTVLPNLQDPKSYSRLNKAGITFVVALASFAGPFASNSLQPAFPQLRRAWSIPNTVVALTTTLFLCATGIAPLWWAFLSERYGRRPVYLSGFLLFTLASVLCAVSTNVGFLLSFRFLQAAGASCAQSVGLGIIADIYVPEERGRATGWWYLGPIAGPLLSPLVSGALITWTSSWRSTMWFNTIFGGVLEMLIVLFLPETSNALKSRQAAALENPPQELTTKTKLTFLQAFKGLFQLFIVRPFRTVLYIRFLPVGLTMPPITQVLLECPILFRSLEIALAYIPPAFGYIIGSISGGYLSDYAYRRAKARDGDRFVPESRLVTAWCGVPFMPIGLLIFGWTLRTHQNWPVPLAGSFIFGLGFMLGTGTIMTYFADVIPGQSASVVACFNLLRNVAAALSAALAAPALNHIGQGWYFTIMSILVCLMSLN
ncbi:hypothetical protein FRC12_013579, partial [Ceratobasidium sp. 428]